MKSITENQMLALMVARYGLPFIGISIEGHAARHLNDRFKQGAANDE